METPLEYFSSELSYFAIKLQRHKNFRVCAVPMLEFRVLTLEIC